ncbi:hypothetical protein CC80DRAFT_442739 [Byssothecium circinans]|uniref:Zn(2)-C6 fungal-type domain-containing protein n=1 Tax=Byssothecium circinans TaxID=147558 RepID=A0A6A5U9L2_9PLEO|nr:hypothetical protein CC80DRAFT_442739 [Byssothecium circinans]
MVRKTAGFVSKRPHRKSRGGCFTCKKKKVKCDEASPVCGYCALRKIDCVYPQESSSSSKASVSPSNAYPAQPYESQVYEAQDVGSRTSSLVPAIHTSSGQLTGTDIKLLDHFKTAVWRTISTRRDYSTEYLNRDWVPSKAIKTNYLLYTILSMSAGHMNTMNPDRRIKTLALSYRQKAFNTYTKALSNITADNYETILMTSLYMMGMVPQPEQPCTYDECLEWMGALFQMMQGLRVLAGLKWAAGIEKLEIYPIFKRELNTLPPPPTLRCVPTDPKFWANPRPPDDNPMQPNPPNTYGIPTLDSSPPPTQPPISSGRDMSKLPYRPVELMSAGKSPHAPQSWEKPASWQLPLPAFLPPPLMTVLKKLVEPSSAEKATDPHAPVILPALHALSPIFLSLYYNHLEPDFFVRVMALPTFLPPQFLALMSMREPRALVIVAWWFAFYRLLPKMQVWWIESIVPQVLQAVSNVVMRSNDKDLMDAMEGAYRIVMEADRWGKGDEGRERAARKVFEGWDGVYWDDGPKRAEEWRFSEMVDLEGSVS